MKEWSSPDYLAFYLCDGDLTKMNDIENREYEECYQWCLWKRAKCYNEAIERYESDEYYKRKR